MKYDHLLEGLSPEIVAKVKKCTSVEEILQLAKDEKIHLNEEQLDAVSGGGCQDKNIDVKYCPSCGSTNWKYTNFFPVSYQCEDCGFRWE